MEASTEPVADTTTSSGAPKACLPCRRVKMKCRQNLNEASCERCTRKSLPCIFREHRRGRKPGTKISKRAPETRGQTMAASVPVQMSDSGPRSENGPNTPASLTGASEGSRGWQAGDLQPSGLLDHAATHGKFSLESILESTQPTVLGPPQDALSIPAGDPIQLGLINLRIAESLFDSFMDSLNPYICQMDPQLHTFSFVRHKCSFLLTAMLAAAAKALNPSFYTPLHEHSEQLLAQIFRNGKKSIEIAQAVLIMTYWKEPEDARAWILVGYVIRMGMDLGWHSLSSSSSQPLCTNNLEKREQRNIERLWFILFVYDRSMSLQTGKPWMIERNAFIESIESWCKDVTATSNDRLLGALVTLRLLSSEVFKILGPRATTANNGPLHCFESLLSIIKARIEEWQNKWLSCVSKDGCHSFLVRFYGTHLRLQLFSLPLGEILATDDSNVSTDLEALWVSYSSAMEMLHLISSHTPCLYFAQDSIHVMTAYSATFLVKLVLFTPPSITHRLEPDAWQAIRAATSAFAQQSSPPASSCALQARFLEKLINRYARRDEVQDAADRGGAAVGHASEPGVLPGIEFVTGQRMSDAIYTDIDTRDPPAVEEHDSSQMKLDFALPQDEIWSEIFASAGFSI